MDETLNGVDGLTWPSELPGYRQLRKQIDESHEKHL